MLSQNILNQVRIYLNLFKIDGEPAGEVMSDGQVETAAAIILKIRPRTSCLAPTGYGKSEAVSMGVIYRSVFFKEDFIIGAEQYDTSDIIMEKVIDHLFDDNFLTDQLELEKVHELERLRRKRTRENITFKKGGSIKIVSFHGDDDDASATIGKHARNIVLDESPLLTPGKYLQVLKILAGTGSYDDTFLFELGNAIGRNHFMENVKYNPNYYKIDISLEQAIKEGRLDPRFVEEARGKPFFEEFYLCKFPDEDTIDKHGYYKLITSDDLLKVQVTTIPSSNLPMKMGVDVGGGGDFNAYVIRQGRYAWIESFNRSNDTMTNVNEVIRIIDKYTVDVNGAKVRLLKPEEVYIDDIGIGRGASDRLKELEYNISAVSVGERAYDTSRYANIKAEIYWAAREWLKEEQNGERVNKLLQDDRFKQMAWIKYKVSTDKVLQIEPKEKLKEREGKSPDFAEGFALSFAVTPPQPNVRLM